MLLLILVIVFAILLASCFKSKDSRTEALSIALILNLICIVFVSVLGTIITSGNNHANIETTKSFKQIEKTVIRSSTSYYIATNDGAKHIGSPFLCQNDQTPTLTTIKRKQFNYLIIPWTTTSTVYILEGQFQIKDISYE